MGSHLYWRLLILAAVVAVVSYLFTSCARDRHTRDRRTFVSTILWCPLATWLHRHRFPSPAGNVERPEGRGPTGAPGPVAEIAGQHEATKAASVVNTNGLVP